MQTYCVRWGLSAKASETRSETTRRRPPAAREERALPFESIVRQLPAYCNLRGASCAVKVLGCALMCARARHYSKGLCATVCEARGATVAEGLCA